jgi:CheY-like chemotaxis protein
LVGEGADVEVTPVHSAEEALAALDSRPYDCMIVDLVLPGLDGIRLIEQVKTQPRFQELPVIVYTGKELTQAEERKIKTYAESIILKRTAQSPERLLNETALFLHRVEKNMPSRTRQAISDFSQPQKKLGGKKVLVVDDDVRNIFAMTSVLEAHQMQVVFAENGKAGIEALQAHPDIDIVLMDVMMPEMDGYETMRVIRSDPKYKTLPIVAVTAKALKDDREKCVAAGATDYLPKPVDPSKLVELMALWIEG